MTADVETPDYEVFDSTAPVYLTQSEFYEIIRDWESQFKEFQYELCSAIREAGNNSRLDVGLNAGSQGVKDICNAIAGAATSTDRIEARLDDITAALDRQTVVLDALGGAVVYLADTLKELHK